MTAEKGPPERVTLYLDKGELFTFSDPSCGPETEHVYLRATAVEKRERALRDALLLARSRVQNGLGKAMAVSAIDEAIAALAAVGGKL